MIYNIKYINIYLLNVHNNYIYDDIIFNILNKYYRVSLVNRIDKSDIVIKGVFNNDYKWYNRINGGTYNYIRDNNEIKKLIHKYNDKVWIHVSGESPTYNNSSSFYNSNCEYGYGHEYINDNNYKRIPQWYQSIDWSYVGVERNDKAFSRMGTPIKINELTNGISSRTIRLKEDKCALIASHLRSPRDIFLKELSKIVPTDFINTSNDKGLVKLHKRDILSSYRYVLAPENTIFPGYITEKIPEGYACKSIPLGWYALSLNDDFLPDSHINLFKYVSSHDSIQDIVYYNVEHNIKKITANGLAPLITDPTKMMEEIIESVHGIINKLK